jgi:hypothetical protein
MTEKKPHRRPARTLAAAARIAAEHGVSIRMEPDGSFTITKEPEPGGKKTVEPVRDFAL